MRIEDGTRTFDEAAVHLTVEEARRVVDELNRLIEEMASADFSPNLGGVSAGGRDLDLVVYLNEELLEASYAERLEP
jgi:hypothetical protein